jgi:pimeloyl-ACP methyl ester carboxylesterase
MSALETLPLPGCIRPRCVSGANGLDVHILEAGFEGGPRPLVLMLHGFPELGYSWRKIMPALADAGYHVIAPDQRGYGRTTGWDAAYDGDLPSYHVFNLVRDALALVAALGVRQVHAVVGHDFGSPVAAYCALIRPDVFRSVVLMSAPFGGVPELPFGTAGTAAPSTVQNLHEQLAALPRPRLHYQRYYASREADRDMRLCPQGLHAFLRAYFHVKSADWPQNAPRSLGAMSAEALAKLPEYYVMEMGKGMAETVAQEMPSEEAITQCTWLPDAELEVYAKEFGRTGFQGALQWYRSLGTPSHLAQFTLFSGRRIEVPSWFIAGEKDWGIYQRPGDFEAMQAGACADLRGCHLVANAGHWVQQEQAEVVGRLLVESLSSV